MSRCYNFSAGPACLPTEVIEEAQRHLLDYRDCGASIMEVSHRGKEYSAVHEEAIANLRELMGISDDYAVLFMQGGASTQFALAPINLLGTGRTADYTNSGAWAAKAIKEARLIGNVNVIADTADDIPTRVPSVQDLSPTPGAAYLHLTSNETISGAQWQTFPQTDAPLVADMSSDILSRAINVSDFGVIYAGLQKNLGPAGAALVIVRKDLADRVPADTPTMFKYSTHIEKNSLFNTPPCFAIYILMLVTRWLKQQGLDTVFERNAAKAAKLYAAIDGSDFYTGTTVPECRSNMNVTWRLPSEDLEKQFVAEADGEDLRGLKGHRSVGGIRASIYNAMPASGVDTLIDFMQAFAARRGG